MAAATHTNASRTCQPSPDELRRRLRLDEASGALFWKPREVRIYRDKGWNTRYAGRPAFAQIDAYGYLCGAFDGWTYKAHRVIWAMTRGAWPGGEIDHINGVRVDNRPVNLRIATSSQNKMNRAAATGGTSVYRGVALDKATGRWAAYCGKDGAMHHLGRFDTERDAALAYNAAAAKLHGAYAVLNVVE